MGSEQRVGRWFRGAPLIALALGVLGYLQLSSLRQPPETRSVTPLPPLVSTVPIGASPERLTLQTQGEVVPFRQLNLAAEVAGRIQQKAPQCRAGHAVRRGDLLLTLDPRDYDLQIERIQQSLQQAEVSLQELDLEQQNVARLKELAVADLELQENDLKRRENLSQQQVASQANLDTARRGQIQARNALQLLDNQLTLIPSRRIRLQRERDALQVDLQQALLDRQRTEIRAPIDGVVVQDLVEQDDYVQRGATVVRLEDTTQVEVRFDLKLDELRWIWNEVQLPSAEAASSAASSAASYELPALPLTIDVELQGQTFHWTGVLSRYDDAGLNPATRTVPCVALVEQPRHARRVKGPEVELPGPPALLRGMFVTVQIDLPSRLPLVSVPTTALRPGNRLWLLQNDRLVVSTVDVALVESETTLLLANQPGLSVGQPVIVSPLAVAVDGMEVRREEVRRDEASRPSSPATATVPPPPSSPAHADAASSAEVAR